MVFVQRQGFQRLALLDAVVDQLTHTGVGIPEGHTLFHQIVGAVGGVDEAFGGGPAQLIHPHSHGLVHGGEHIQAQGNRIHRVKNGLLILLHILVVGQGQALHDRQQAHQVAVHPARLTADQLGNIGVLLLGHDGGAGGIGIVQGDKAELIAGPQDDLLGEPGQMHHQNGQGRSQFQDIVPVGDAVDGVFRGLVKAQGLGRHKPVDGIGGAAHGAGAQGALIQPGLAVGKTAQVPGQHFGVSHGVMGKGGGLGPLQMGIAGHDGFQMELGLVADGGNQLFDLLLQVADLIAQVHLQVHGHLIVAGPGRVEPLAGSADALRQQDFHIHMDVLVLLRKLDLAGAAVVQNLPQGLDDQVGFRLGDDALGAQHGGVGHGAGDILLIHPLVVGNGGVETVHQLIRVLFKPSGPKFHGSFVPFFP